MNIEGLGRILREQKESAAIPAPKRTGLYNAAEDNLEMVAAYLQDGDAFLASGDPVNALAAFCYGSGWLHCGAACGLYSVRGTPCPLSEAIDPLPAGAHDRLAEKADRYARLLMTARASVKPAPEEGTALCAVAGRVTVVTAVYAGLGGRFLARGELENGLACFSYGHGWLDAGVRAGLYSVLANRHLFTI